LKKWLEPLSTAWVGVVTHKLRSFLTILGIVIGIAAVISLMSIGKGVEEDILSNIESLGSNLIFIFPGASAEGGVKSATGSSRTLTQEDASVIEEKIAHLDSVASTYSTSLQLVFEGENMRAQVTGVPPEYKDIRNLEVASGAFFTEYDYQRGAKLFVIGSEVKETLFEDAYTVGQKVRMGKNIVRVIGVLESKGESKGSLDNVILLPLTAMQQMVAQPRTSQGDRIVSSIELTVSNEQYTESIIEEITSLLRDRHRLGPTADDDFRITSMQEISETISEATGTMTLLLGAIAAISLLVGGIGVMNIMLVSVLERTREIGIRKALGAKEHDIWIQFLIEAAFLTLAGGIVGIAVGWVVSYIVSSMEIIPAIVTPDIVILAVSVSVGIGMFFGFYPAWNASRLNPIEALRFE
jgi:putative ABC transport system permease protein